MKVLVDNVKPFLGPQLKIKDIDIYGFIFKLHTKLTVHILVLFSILVSCHAYVGKTIECIVGRNDIKTVVESICWVNGTFTMRNATKMVNGRENVQYQKYYQWIVVLLLLQALLTVLPHYLWKSWERGRIKQICKNLTAQTMVAEMHNYKDGKSGIISYLRRKNSRVHGAYVFSYVICEIMNFLILVINMWILNAVFDQFWCRYLPAVMALFTTEGKTFSSLASDLFPLTAKCEYRYYGASGSEQIQDALCLLSANIVNEKVFAFLYIWYVLLLALSGCNLIWRSVTLISSNMRLKIIQSQTLGSVSKRKLRDALRNDNIGDWFVISLIGKNINSFLFEDVLLELSSEPERNKEANNA